MFYGIERTNLAYVQKVLAMNFDANLQHENGYTPLAYAAMRGNVRMVELLLSNGASAALTTREGDTPVELALRMGHSEIAELLRNARQAEQQKAQPQPA
jgi:26S proteasome non-ATPase regulatory subunit 10